MKSSGDIRSLEDIVFWEGNGRRELDYGLDQRGSDCPGRRMVVTEGEQEGAGGGVDGVVRARKSCECNKKATMQITLQWFRSKIYKNSAFSPSDEGSPYQHPM